jgi:hypothetical protein
VATQVGYKGLDDVGGAGRKPTVVRWYDGSKTDPSWVAWANSRSRRQGAKSLLPRTSFVKLKEPLVRGTETRVSGQGEHCPLFVWPPVGHLTWRLRPDLVKGLIAAHAGPDSSETTASTNGGNEFLKPAVDPSINGIWGNRCVLAGFAVIAGPGL